MSGRTKEDVSRYNILKEKRKDKYDCIIIYILKMWWIIITILSTILIITLIISHFSTKRSHEYWTEILELRKSLENKKRGGYDNEERL